MRFIEIVATSRPERIDLRVGDVVRLGATGVRPEPPHDPDPIVEILGPLGTGSATPDGTVIEAAGVPATVLLVARRPGAARLEVVVGDPFATPSTRPLTIRVSTT